jgi:hypothetical protein
MKKAEQELLFWRGEVERLRTELRELLAGADSDEAEHAAPSPPDIRAAG